MRTYYGIDPGEERSGIVLYQVWPGVPTVANVEFAGWLPNEDVWRDFGKQPHGTIGVIEDVVGYGPNSPLGNPLIETIKWIGVFRHEWMKQRDQPMHEISRPDIKLHLLGQRAGTSGQVHAALYERFGGSVKAAKGTKDKPGPCHRVSGHAWDALAVAVTYHEHSVAERSRDGDE